MWISPVVKSWLKAVYYTNTHTNHSKLSHDYCVLVCVCFSSALSGLKCKHTLGLFIKNLQSDSHMKTEQTHSSTRLHNKEPRYWKRDETFMAPHWQRMVLAGRGETTKPDQCRVLHCQWVGRDIKPTTEISLSRGKILGVLFWVLWPAICTAVFPQL